MSPRLRSAIVLAVLVVGGWLFWRWWKSPERRISRELDELAESLSKDGEQSQIASALAARSAGEHFAPGFLVRALPYAELSDQQQLMSSVMLLHAAGRRVAVDFSDRDIAVQEPQQTTATVDFVATGLIDRGNGPGRERWRVHSLWIEENGDWLISELELVERLESGGLPFG